MQINKTPDTYCLNFSPKISCKVIFNNRITLIGQIPTQDKIE